MKFPTDPRLRAWAIATLLWTVNLPALVSPALKAGGLELSAIITVTIFVVTGWLLCAGLYEWLRTRSQRAPRQLLTAAIIGTIVASLLLGLADGVGGIVLEKIGLTPAKPLSYVAVRAVANTIFLGWVFAIFAAATLLLEFAARLRKREEQLVLAESQTAQARATATAARLAALRYQLNPHFLFNTLNAVSAAVVTQRTADAEAMLARLASFLRMTLSTDASAFIPLEDELGAVEAYLEIEAERFRERLSVQVACPEALRDAQVPSFVLQPLVENAIKHGVSRSRNRVSLVIRVETRDDDLAVTVSDDARPLSSSLPAPSSGIGLAAIRERLEVLYGPRGTLTAQPGDPGFTVTLRLPLDGAAGQEAA
ncbi:histidine kinase [Caulobacter sp.]|uniref:sensor histidine kinase n=1 Tax=Caulobacter sp. TaxID=78 RepID=UPI001B2BCAD5|nr:histidine kinase [Caulobacter sp.]MBO9543869.1 histidine kinase [Caulobacter sp.]